MGAEKGRAGYLRKLRGARARGGMPYPKWHEPLVCGLGGALTIAALRLLSVELRIVACFLVPFGATCALVFGLPGAPVSQPRNVIAGHILSGLIGLAVYAAFGQVTWWTLSLAIGLAMAAMAATRTYHPPAAVTVLLPILQQITDPVWLLMPVAAGAVIVVAIALVYNNLFAERQYPAFWW